MPNDEIRYAYPWGGGVEITRTQRHTDGTLAPHPYETALYDNGNHLREVQRLNPQGLLSQIDRFGEDGRLSQRLTFDREGTAILRQSFNYHRDGSWSTETRDLRIPMARGEGWVASREQHAADGSFIMDRFHTDGSGSTRTGHDGNGNPVWQEIRNRDGELTGQRTEISFQESEERRNARMSPGYDGVANYYQGGAHIEERYEQDADGRIIGGAPYLVTHFDQENHPISAERRDIRSERVFESVQYDSQARVIQVMHGDSYNRPNIRESFEYNRDGSWTREVRSLQTNESGSEWQLARREQHGTDGRYTVESFNRDGSGQRGHYDSHNNQLWSENFDRNGNRLGERTMTPRESVPSPAESGGEVRAHTTAEERREGSGASPPSDKERKSPPPEARDQGPTRH